MGSDVTDMRAIGMMKEVEDDLNRNIRVYYIYYNVYDMFLLDLHHI